MAYRFEKEPNGDTALVLDGWADGIAPDPYSGINDLRNVNIGTVLGEVSVGFGLTSNTTSGGFLGVPIHKTTKFANGVATLYFILDDTSQVWSSSTYTGTFTALLTSNTTIGATATNQGLVFWSPPAGGTGYLFKFRNGSIDYLANGAGTWVSGWKSITASVEHFALASQDGAVYFCNGTTVGSLLEVAGKTFDPTDATTYTFTANALQLPRYDTAISLAEQSTNLLVGGTQNAIYPWDRLSTSYAYPIFIADTYIRRMVTANTNVFIFPGNATGRGRVYITNGTQADLWFKFPDYISGYQEPYYKFYDAIYHRDSLIFGVEVGQNSNGTVIASPTTEVWAIDCETKAFRSISTITGGSTASARVLIPDQSGSVAPGYGYIVGISGASNLIQNSSTAAGTGTAIAYSDLLPVGTFLQKKTFSQAEFKLGYPLQSGETIVLGYVKDFTTTGTIGTFTSTTSTFSDYANVNFEKAQWLQIKATLTGNSAISGCRLKEIRLR